MCGLFKDILGSLEESVDNIKENINKKVPEQIAEDLRESLVTGIKSGGPPGVNWKPLSKNTLKIRQQNPASKGGNRPLQDSQHLVNSVEIRVNEEGNYEVGWFGEYLSLKACMSIFGSDAAEYVRTPKINVTPTMAMYMASQYGVLLGNEVKIPPRPLFIPVLENVLKKYDGWEAGSISESPGKLVYEVKVGEDE